MSLECSRGGWEKQFDSSLANPWIVNTKPSMACVTVIHYMPGTLTRALLSRAHLNSGCTVESAHTYHAWSLKYGYQNNFKLCRKRTEHRFIRRTTTRMRNRAYHTTLITRDRAVMSMGISMWKAAQSRFRFVSTLSSSPSLSSPFPPSSHWSRG